MKQPDGRFFITLSRLFDECCACAGLVLLLPLFAVLTLIILIDDGWPIFFRQVRVGRGGRLFLIWKFRTMRQASRGLDITAAGDPRVTRAGAVLRRYKLDEIPQLVNILKGDMSLVGPRPEVPGYVQPASNDWRAVLQVRPGITDPASLLFRDEETILGATANPNALYLHTVLPRKLSLSRAYLKSRTFGRDLRLILLTIWYSLFPKAFDAYQIYRLMPAYELGYQNVAKESNSGGAHV